MGVTVSKFIIVQFPEGKPGPGSITGSVVGGPVAKSLKSEALALEVARGFAAQFPGEAYRIYREVAVVESLPVVTRTLPDFVSPTVEEFTFCFGGKEKPEPVRKAKR